MFGLTSRLLCYTTIPLLKEIFCEKLRFIQIGKPKENLSSIDFAAEKISCRPGVKNKSKLKNASKTKRFANGPAQFAR